MQKQAASQAPRLQIQGYVTHQLKNRKNSPVWHLTFGLLLRHFNLVERSESPVSKGHALQRLYRTQLKAFAKQNISENGYLSEEAKSKKLLKTMYELNCRPSGFYVSPPTLTCQEFVCPWCFVRRVYKRIYLPLCRTARKIQNAEGKRFKIAYWRRDVLFEDAPNELPFFPRFRGPHNWLDAYFTVQVVVPIVSTKTNSLKFRHVGVQLVDIDTDVSHNLEKRIAVKRSRNFQHSEAKKFTTTPKNNPKDLRLVQSVFIDVLCSLLSYPFHLLYLPENYAHFERLRSDFKRKKFIRVSSVYVNSKKEDLNGR